jgi:hypothetical protein
MVTQNFILIRPISQQFSMFLVFAVCGLDINHFYISVEQLCEIYPYGKNFICDKKSSDILQEYLQSKPYNLVVQNSNETPKKLTAYIFNLLLAEFGNDREKLNHAIVKFLPVNVRPFLYNDTPPVRVIISLLGGKKFLGPPKHRTAFKVPGNVRTIAIRNFVKINLDA